MADERDDSSALTWFLAGAACGAAAALLFAPDSGEETRKKIMKHKDKAYEALSDGTQGVADKGKDLFDRGRQLAEEAAELFDRGRKLVKG